MKNLIAFDLDGVLIDIMTPIKKWLLRIYNITIDPDFWSYKLENETELSKKQVWEVIGRAIKDIKGTPIYPGAHELLTKIYEITKEPPLILTARKYTAATETYQIVKKMMKKTPFNLVLKHRNASKYQYLDSYYYYVEDRRRTALELSQLGFFIPLVKTSYNKIENIEEHPRIVYINGVQDLIPKIDAFIKK